MSNTKKKKTEEKKSLSERTFYMEGLSIGLCIGLLLGISILKNSALGGFAGAFCGAILGACIRKVPKDGK